jgi:hypothetical protein
MPKKMNPVLQRNKFLKELEKKDNPHHPTWSGDIEAALDHVDVNDYLSYLFSYRRDGGFYL